MSKHNAGKFLVFILLISIGVGLCACSFPQPKPEEGIWYCEELMIEIDFYAFSANPVANPPYFAKKYSADGTYQDVGCHFDYGSVIYICSLDYQEDYLRGNFLYQKETRFREESFTVTTIDGEHTYIFERTDD